MNRNTLAKDIDKCIDLIKSIQLKHGLLTGPDDMPNQFDKAVRCLDDLKVEAIIDEVIGGRK